MAAFRANPDYELVAFADLPGGQRELLNDLRRDPGFYGVLRPRPGSGLGVKSVCHNTARLVRTLATPGPLPDDFRALPAIDREPLLARLVWDGVLQVEVGGEFRSGAAAAGPFGCGDTPSGEGGVARLSVAALRYAEHLAEADIVRLSARLYFYNRRPVTPRLTSRFPTETEIAGLLGVAPGGRATPHLTAWSRVPATPGNDAWVVRDRAPAGRLRADATGTYKLYVSPRFEAVGDVFPRVVAVFTDSPVPRFKVGRTLPGLLRPDKIVAYFSDGEALGRVAATLAGELRGTPAHGTPFTAALTPCGLLSWGVDPPPGRQVLGWQERESWRLWLTNRLAAALLAARATPGAAVEPWQAALRRIRLDGVDPATWTPTGCPGPHLESCDGAPP